MVKPIGSFEWGVLLVGTATVTTIVVLYAIGWERSDVSDVPAAAPVTVEVKPATIVAQPRSPRQPTPALRTTFAFTATRGDSWIQARAGSPKGPVLYEGKLLRGETVRLRSRQLWIRFGAAAHVDVLIDGRRAQLPAFGTFDAFAGPRGVRPDRTEYRTIYATAAQSP